MEGFAAAYVPPPLPIPPDPAFTEVGDLSDRSASCT